MTDATTIQPQGARAEGFKKLRAVFPKAAYGKLPRATSKDARPGKCQECGGWHKLPAIHLDYIGHAETTDRLLSVDSEWNWEPLAFDEHGLPRFIMSQAGYPMGLWIKLTVLGVSRLGYGSVEPGAFDPEKQLIGDALRNAAMRFGVALDLWSKAELESTIEATNTQTGEVAPTSRDDDARMQSEVDAFARGPAEPPKARVIEGIPIRCTKTWEQVQTLPLGGKGKFQTMTLGSIVDSDLSDDREPVEYFEGTVLRAILDLWNRMTPKKKAEGVGLVSECALIAYQELLDRRSPPPTFQPDEPGTKG